MRNRLNLLTACVLMTACAVLAQQGFESVDNIMTELMNYTGETAPAVVDETTADSVTPDETPVAVVEEPEASEALVEENSELFAGDFTEKSQGLADLVKIAPENKLARMYPRTLLERDQRTAEIAGLDAVDAAWSTELVLRSYDLVSGAGERMKLGDETRAVDVATLFPQVEFPKGSSAIYQPKTKTIFVNNTPENLAVLETMMETMGVLKGFGDADQVEIEAKFIEVAEGTLEELGFQWNFEDPTSISVGGTDLAVDDGFGGLFSDALRGTTATGIVGINAENPYDPDDDVPIYGLVPGTFPFSRTMDLGDGTTAASGDWSSFNIVDTFDTETASLSLNYAGDNAFEMLISALDQSTGVDVMSAPRVLTRSGEEATIRVGELHSYPQVYESDANYVSVNVTYEDFNDQLLGVELTVSPVVTDERNIMLELNPRITELAGWKSYQLAPANYFTAFYQQTTKAIATAYPLVAKLPILKKREIKTQVTIADGSTIGMGGLINEKIESFEDKVPVLGSLPLVGRLFRSEGERVVKRNLLMFVTAKIVEPNGRINTSRSFE